MSALEQVLGGPAIEVVAKATRRRFTVEYKRRSSGGRRVQDAGRVGALLRREGLYSSHLTTWRAARERGELAGAPKKRGPARRVLDPRDKQHRRAQARETADGGSAPSGPRRWSKCKKKWRRCWERRWPAEHLVMATVAQSGPTGHRADVRGARLAARHVLSSATAPRVPRRRGGRRRAALGAGERARVLAALHEPRFVDLAPAEVYATLLDEGRYLCSERTMYRILAEHAEVRERREPAAASRTMPPRAARPPAQRAVELGHHQAARARRSGPTSTSTSCSTSSAATSSAGWWRTARAPRLAERLIQRDVRRQGIERGQLTIHADRGAAMTSKPVALLLADLGVTKTHSRPHVSNDNPFSEAQFKTLKYRRAFSR